MTAEKLSWLTERFPIMNIWQRYFKDYYVARNLNLYYCFGVLAIILLVNQLVSGFWLSFFYSPSIESAFSSIESIMRDVKFGWLFRYLHSTGASCFFIVIYMHIFRGLLYGSYQRPRELVWLMGVGLYVLLMMEAFFGYLLPWGQLSYWGAHVITSLLGVIPWVGDDLVTWVRGDYAVGASTLQRFFALHVIAVPSLVVLVSYLHVVALHHVGSNNPDGIDLKPSEQGTSEHTIAFYPYYVVKDLMVVMGFFVVFFFIVFFFPTLGGFFLEANNAIPANPLQTPESITPLWYMSPFYAILRAVPHKALGVILMNAAIFILFFMPWLDKSPVRSIRYKGAYSKIALTILVLSFISLACLGMSTPSALNICLSRVAMAGYFGFFILMPWYTRREITQKPYFRL